MTPLNGEIERQRRLTS